ALYREPGEAVVRVAFTGLVVVYLGLLASFLIQLRWLTPVSGDADRATHALMLTIFVPKCADIGAYCAGHLFGRHRMTPLLSPKKTWEGAAGGFVLAVVIAVFGASLGAQPDGWVVKAIVFGIVVAAAGVVGECGGALLEW